MTAHHKTYPLYIAFLMALTLCLDLVFYVGLFGSDDVMYLNASYNIANGHTPFLTIFDKFFFPVEGSTYGFNFGGLRFAFVIPLTLVQLISNSDIFILSLYGVLCHMGIVYFSMRLAMLVHDRTVGFITGVLVACSPFFFIYATGVLPDLQATLLTVLSAYFLYLGFHQPFKFQYSKHTALIIAGLFMGLAYSTKITSLIMLVPCAAFILTKSRAPIGSDSLYNGLLFLAGLIFIVILDYALLYSLFTDPLSRFETLAGYTNYFQKKAEWQGGHFFGRFIYAFDQANILLPKELIYGSVLLFLLYPLLKGNQKLLWFFGLWPAFYLTAGTTSFSEYSPPSLNVRYFAICVPFIMIAISFVLVKMVRHIPNIKAPQRTILLAFMLIAYAAVTLTYNASAHGKSGLPKHLDKAGFVNSFKQTYQVLTYLHPDYQIVASGHFSGRVAPLFYKNRPDNLIIQGHKEAKPTGGLIPNYVKNIVDPSTEKPLNIQLPFVYIGPWSGKDQNNLQRILDTMDGPYTLTLHRVRPSCPNIHENILQNIFGQAVEAAECPTDAFDSYAYIVEKKEKTDDK